MISKVKGCGLLGIDGYRIDVETDISNGLPGFDIVGLGDAAVRESKERVRSAIKNSGIEFPGRKITINLAPANIRKEGSSLDLAIAVGILAAFEKVYVEPLKDYIFVGELSLDGGIKPVNGVLSIAIHAMESGIENLIVSEQNAKEAAVVSGINVLPAKDLNQVINHLNELELIEPFKVDLDEMFERSMEYAVDFADVKGQENVKRALEVAASGGHNCLLIGSPGCGKTMLAQRLPTILPALTFGEALEVTKVHSIAGLLQQNTSLVTTRPFRSPHHTISSASLVGGGKYPKPGEISLSHFGVLFLDELPEFRKDALEVMRQPLEDGHVSISRVNGTLQYPSRTTLIAALNPCKCGNFLDESKECTCSPNEVKNYLSKLSGPLLDRIDLHIEVGSVKYKDLEEKKPSESSQAIRDRVNKARKIQIERYKKYKIYSNSQLGSSLMNKFCTLDEKGSKLLRDAFDKLGLSARAHSRILKVARTIADMDGSEDIKMQHVAEAIQYRSLDRKYWNC